MVVLIWILCIFANAIITVALKESGIILGALPTALLYVGTMSVATALSSKWKNHKRKKNAEKEEYLQNEIMAASSVPATDKNDIQAAFCTKCGSKLVYNSRFCQYCGTEVNKDICK